MRVAVVGLAVLLAAGQGVARADDPRAARQHFEDGSKLYDLGKFREAAKEYEEAYKAKPDPALLFNIGQAYRAGGDNVQAVTAYKSYLRRLPEAGNRHDVEAHIAKLQKLIDEPRPTQKGPPTGTLTPPPESAATAASSNPARLTAAAPALRDKPPIYKKWWLWTAVGGAVAAAVVVGAVVATTPKDASSPPNTYGVSLR